MDPVCPERLDPQPLSQVKPLQLLPIQYECFVSLTFTFLDLQIRLEIIHFGTFLKILRNNVFDFMLTAGGEHRF